MNDLFYYYSHSQQVCGLSSWTEKYLSVNHAVGTNQVNEDCFYFPQISTLCLSTLSAWPQVFKGWITLSTR